MRSFENVIVGSGPAGVSAAMALDRPGTAIIDVGFEAPGSFGWDSLGEAREAGNVEKLLGAHWEMLVNLAGPRMHAKLKAPLVRYVESGEAFRVFGQGDRTTSRGRGSYAKGGFANVWGAQVYRYTKQDLALLGDWVVTDGDLQPYYDLLESHLGIAGDNDDLSEYFGASGNLLPAVPITPSATHILSAYTRRKNALRDKGLTIGKPRLAVLTRPHGNRPQHHFGGTEFFDTESPGIYTPSLTLNEIISAKRVSYLSGLRLENYRERDDGVLLDLTDVNTGEKVAVKTGKLLLACGTLHSSKLVLRGNNAGGQGLPILEHPPALTPVFLPKYFGYALPETGYPTQLAACYRYQDERQLVNFYYAAGMLRTDLLTDIPFALDDGLWLLNRILSGFLVLQVWRPSPPNAANRLRLDQSGEIRIEYPYRPRNPAIPGILKLLRGLGAYGHSSLIQESPVGWGFHFSGSLPMRRIPGPFETDSFGRLWNSKRVHVIDGSVLPSLPAKNPTFTIMANAMRIAHSIK